MQENVFKTTIGGREVSVQIGKYCGQANGSCFVTCGETVVMVNATMNKEPRPGQDFFPLSVDYEEKLYTIGKIPGGFKKREGRPSDVAILKSRLIDRPLRPLFPKGFYNDVSIVATPLSVDTDIQPEPLAMLGSSIALSISDIPFEGPTGSVNIGCVDGKFIINPTVEESENSVMDLTVSGTKEAVLMVEAGAKEVTEELMLDAIMFAHEEIKKQCEFVESIAKAVGKEKTDKIVYDEIPEELDKAVREYANAGMDKVLEEFDRHAREAKEEEFNEDVFAHFADIYPDDGKWIGLSLYNLKKEKVRRKILDNGVRPDGRTLTQTTIPAYREVYSPAETDAPINNYKRNGVLDGIYGNAIFETSRGYIGNFGIDSDTSNFPTGNTPFFIRGGNAKSGVGSGIFSFDKADGAASETTGFRPVLAY